MIMSLLSMTHSQYWTRSNGILHHAHDMQGLDAQEGQDLATHGGNPHPVDPIWP